MNKTLRISFSLKNTYRVNSILFSLKQIPLIKKLLPESLYQVHGLKIFGNVISAICEVLAVFFGKLLYFLIMLMGAGMLYKDIADLPSDRLFLHILLFLTAIGAFANTFLFNPTRDKYYAMFLMRMDARSYTLTDYGYAILKVLVGFLPFSIMFGLPQGIPLWICLLIPFFVAGAKITAAAGALLYYEKSGKAPNENSFGKSKWIGLLVLLAAAYGLPAIGVLIPGYVTVGLMIFFILCGIAAARKIFTFPDYRSMYQQVLSQSINQMDTAKRTREQSNKAITADTAVTSRRSGFEYLNELFIKRHQKILWKATKKIALVSVCLILGGLLAFYVAPEVKERINAMLLTYLPYFVFIMYAINRGTGFTRALFMNCDHSLLTYFFYKEPKFVLKLFQIRLREIIKVNLLPAVIIGAGLDILLYASGGTDHPLNYAVLFVSVVCLSVFFSAHYLTIYYLLQPYNAGTELKSGTYQIVLSVTYVVCFCMMQVQMPTLVFGLLTIAFCILYCIAACVLVYRFAPKTFRLRT